MKKIKENIVFYFDLIKFVFVIILMVAWSLLVLSTLGLLRFLEKFPEKIKRRKFLLQVQILKILEKVLTFFKK